MNPIDYNGKTAVITGAASGMGFCASEELVRLGATVVMCDINAELLEKAVGKINTVGPGRALACVCDVRKFSDAEKAAKLALEKTGRIDLLIPFAGGYEPRVCGSCGIPFYEQPIDVIDWGIDVNLKGAVYFARACMPTMVKAKSGVICCIGSVTGFEGDGCGAMYGTAKSGLFNFVKGLAQAGARHGVRALCVTPGPVMTRAAMANMKTLTGFAADTQELVDFILHLVSDDCRCITGTNHVIDCGRLALQPA
jgi:NAD(P)-dependent dehydrogenase (short-subunit alcohol dehydrogenase family)